MPTFILTSRLPPCFSIDAWIDSIARSSRSTAAYYPHTRIPPTSALAHAQTYTKTHLVRRVRAENVQRGRDELRLDGDGVGALALARAQRALDGVDARWGVARELDVRAQLDRLRREPARDSAREDRERRRRDGRRQRGEHRIRLAASEQNGSNDQYTGAQADKGEEDCVRQSELERVIRVPVLLPERPADGVV